MSYKALHFQIQTQFFCQSPGDRQTQARATIISISSLIHPIKSMKNPGQVFSYEQLYDRVWKAPVNKGIHNMQVCMARVRQKLEQLCPGAHYIETVRGKGYRFRQEPQQ